MKPVIVGLDDSGPATVALNWAADYAARAGAPLTAITVMKPFEIVGRAASFDEIAILKNHREPAQHWLSDVVSKAVASLSVDVETRVVEGHPVDELVVASRDAQLVVVGDRGAGGFRRMLLGSVGTGLLHHAPCPVVVVRGTGTPGREARRHIVVGVDGSMSAERAVTWAAAYTRMVDGDLTVVGVWEWPTFQDAPIVYGDWDPERVTKERVEAAMHASGLPADRVSTSVAKGHAAKVLLENAQGADLLVLGSRGLEGVAVMLGSTGAYCAHHATCPVAVVRPS